MFLSCPACQTRYFVDPTALGNQGRTVRCARCGEKWHQQAPEDQPRDLALPETFEEEEELAEDIQEETVAQAPYAAPRTFAPAPAPPKTKGRDIVGWVLLAVVIIGGATGAVLFREPIVTLWPPANRAFSLVGLPVQVVGKGLSLVNVTSHREVSGDGTILVVQGDVSNVSTEPRPVPMIRVSLFDAIDRVVEDTTLAPGRPQLPAGQRIAFQARLPNPPDTARRMEVTFVESRAEAKK